MKWKKKDQKRYIFMKDEKKKGALQIGKSKSMSLGGKARVGTSISFRAMSRAKASRAERIVALSFN